MSVTIDSQMLDRIGVATPCRADWNAMTGDDKARFCQTCHKNVYNVALMSSDEAVALIQEKEGNLCVRLSRRADGTLITNDCPVGAQMPSLKSLSLSPRKFVAATLALVAAVFGSALASNAKPRAHNHRHTPAWHRAKKSNKTPLISTGLIMMAPTPTPTPKAVIVIRGVESQSNASASDVTPKVITVAPFKK